MDQHQGELEMTKVVEAHDKLFTAAFTLLLALLLMLAYLAWLVITGR